MCCVFVFVCCVVLCFRLNNVLFVLLYHIIVFFNRILSFCPVMQAWSEADTADSGGVNRCCCGSIREKTVFAVLYRISYNRCQVFMPLVQDAVSYHTRSMPGVHENGHAVKCIIIALMLLEPPKH